MSNSKSKQSQTSILSFFGNGFSSKKNPENVDKFPKKTHQKQFPEYSTASKEDLLENLHPPLKKSIPPISSMKLENQTIKPKMKKKIINDSDDEENEEENQKIIEEKITDDGINLNNFLKETLDENLKKDPNSLEINIFNTFQGTKIHNNQNNNIATPNKSRSRSRSRSPVSGKNKTNNKNKKKKKNDNDNSSDEELIKDKDDSIISNEETIAKSNFFSNPHDLLPDFLKPENIKDKNGNKPNSPEYDCNTLYVPENFLKEQTPAQKQFWEFKRDNFDKVLLFKLGKFYEMFYDDAIIGNQILDLNWMGDVNKKLHVGFPEKVLDIKSKQLVEAGFKVAVIEQMETVDAFKERQKSTNKKIEKTIKREICNVYTKGTFCQIDDENVNIKNKNDNKGDNKNENIKNLNNNKNKFICAIFCQQKTENLGSEEFLSQDIENISRNCGIEWGICIFDITTLKFYMGKIQEDDNKFLPKSQSTQSCENSYSKIKTILYNTAPEEIICVRQNLPVNIMSFINDLASKPIITNLKYTYKFNELNELCRKYFGEDFQNWDEIITKQFSNEQENHVTCVAFYLSIIYLEKCLLAENSLPTATFYDYTGNTSMNPNKKMIMDYQAINNLELIQTKLDPRNKEAGSVVEYLNKAVSPFGKRLLRNWILNPLCDIEKINERLDIIEDLIKHDEIITKFRNNLSKWSDIERQCTKFFKLAMGNNSQAVYFEDVNKNRLKEFFKLLNFLNNCQNIFNIFDQYINDEQFKFKSELLIKKITIGEYVPDLSSEIKQILDDFHIIEKKDEKGNSIYNVESKPGVYQEYDDCKEKLSNIKKIFDEILLKEKKRLKCAIIQYAHTKAYRYELEIPENYVKNNRPKEYILTTSKKGYLRFHTKEILQNVSKLEETEEEMKEITKKMNTELFKHFYEKHKIIDTFINCISELDCLMALAFISLTEQDKFSRPKFIDISENNNYPYIELKDSIHPCLMERTPFFVPNDIILGKNGKSLIVITGPNMGGKSTLLRQVCISAIFAQIGCYVPAKKCVMTLVDRIFTRIGANDKLLEGKSTFYVEMEETKNIVENATINSLIIMDELGRGTSTKDGKIIAKTILYQIENKLKSRCLFTTHYHDIINWCQKEPKIDLFFMDSNVDNKKDITFLYKFKQGICPESYGIEVAKLAGIPEKVIKKATEIKENNLLDIQ